MLDYLTGWRRVVWLAVMVTLVLIGSALISITLALWVVALFG